MADLTTAKVALDLYAAGYCPIRATTDGEKKPFGAWKQYQAERPTEDQVRAWFAGGYPALGIVTGAVSGNAEMLEFEGRAVREGIFEAWGDLMDASGLGEIKNKLIGWVDFTPSGGIHFHYRIDGRPVPGNTKLAERPATADERAADPDTKRYVLIETRGEGGFVVAAPSNGTTHPSGKPWTRRSGGPRTTPVLTVDEHEALMTACRALDQMPEPAAEPNPFANPTFADSGGDRPGDDHNRRARWEDILTGWTKVFTAGTTSHWRRPGKSIGTSATTGRNDGDNLYVFSTSTEFDPEKPYSKFAAYTLLQHHGDYRAAAKALAAAGYGEQKQRISSTPGTPDPDPDPGIDDTGFWVRPELASIRTYAQAQMASPWGVLAVVLGRVVCQVPVTIVLPAIIYGHASLNLTIALVGTSGGGKGGSGSVAASAVQIGVPAFQTHTLGSGQGIAHGYGHWNKNTKAIERHAATVLFTVEEVDHLAGLNAQNGSTTLAELRRFGMGEKLGHLFVDPTKRVQIPAHTYRGAVIVGVQPARARVILDATDGGTPQRFFWAPTIDAEPPEVEPDRPDPWPWALPRKLPDPDPLSGLRPIPVCQAAIDAIRQGQRDRNAGKGDPLDGHRLLTRERVAAALGLLNGHYEITEQDWTLAGTAMAVSDATRARVVATLKEKKREANRVRGEAEGDRHIIIEEKISDAAIQRACRGILRHVTGKDWATGGEIRRSLRSGIRREFDAAAGLLVDTGQIEAEPTEYRGQTGQRYRLSKAER